MCEKSIKIDALVRSNAILLLKQCLNIIDKKYYNRSVIQNVLSVSLTVNYSNLC